MKSYNNITSSGSKIYHYNEKSSIQTVQESCIHGYSVVLYTCIRHTVEHTKISTEITGIQFGSQEKESPDKGVILCVGFGWSRVNSLHHGWY